MAGPLAAVHYKPGPQPEESGVKVTQERLEGSRVALTVEVEPEQVQRETDKAYQRLGSRVVVPGFRKGKAPRNILRNFVGEQRIRQETLDQLLPTAYRQALEDSGVQPIADPDVELLTMEADQPLSFKATIPVAPTVELGDYRALKQERKPEEVTDERIDKVVEELRRQNATWEEVTDRPIETGDRVTADVHAEAEGEELIHDHDRTLTVGGNNLPDEVDAALVGTNTGEERTVLVTLPNDFPAANLAGKEAAYTLTVKKIEQPILPPVDDAFAQKVDPEHADVAALRADIRNRLQESSTAAENERVEQAVINDLIANSTLDYPALLVERQLDRSLETFAINISRQGFDPEQYIRMLGLTPEELRTRWRPDAEETVKRDLVLNEVAKAEGIEPSPEELGKEIGRLVGDTPQEQQVELLNNQRLQQAVYASARERMALQRLVELATGEAAPAAEAGTPDATPTESAATPTEEATPPASEAPSGLNAAEEPAPVDAATEGAAEPTSEALPTTGEPVESEASAASDAP